jgi:hypothetical protein
MTTRTIALSLLLLLIANAQGDEQPCSATSLVEGRAGICVYDVGKKPLFTSVRVVLNGEVRGKLARQQPWLWVDAAPGVHVVGIDVGRTPQARRKVQAAAGEINYLRYERVIQVETGFFDTSTAVQADLREVSETDAASDLSQLTR